MTYDMTSVDIYSYVFSFGLSVYVLYKLYDETKHFFVSRRDARETAMALNVSYACDDGYDTDNESESEHDTEMVEVYDDTDEKDDLVLDMTKTDESSELVLMDEDLSDEEYSSSGYCTEQMCIQSENDLDGYYYDELYDTYNSMKFKDVKNPILHKLLQKLKYLNKTCFSDTEDYLENIDRLQIESDNTEESEWSLV